VTPADRLRQEIRTDSAITVARHLFAVAVVVAAHFLGVWPVLAGLACSLLVLLALDFRALRKIDAREKERTL